MTEYTSSKPDCLPADKVSGWFGVIMLIDKLIKFASLTRGKEINDIGNLFECYCHKVGFAFTPKRDQQLLLNPVIQSFNKYQLIIFFFFHSHRLCASMYPHFPLTLSLFLFFSLSLLSTQIAEMLVALASI